MISVENNQKLLTMKQVPSSAGREIKRRRKSRRDPEILIPNDIIEEILMKLPVKSLLRFQIVSRHWGSIIRSKDFGERYMTRRKSKEPRLFFICDDLVKRSKNILFIKTMVLETMSASVEQGRALEFREFRGYLEISESCDGLVCIFAMTIPVRVLNPETGMCMDLPLAKIQRLHIKHPNPYLQLQVGPVQDPNPGPVPFHAFTRFGFGRDNVIGRYKLVWLYNKYPDSKNNKTRCEVLDLENKKWRFVSTRPLDHHHILTDQRPAFVNGSFYWLSGDEEGNPTTETKLIVFDIHTEMFQVISTPTCINRDAYGDKIGICNLDGRLCVSEVKADCKQEFWWRVEEDKNKTTWEKIFSVDLRFTSTWFGGICSQPLTPLAISKDNNKVILSLRDYDNLVALDLDPDSTVYHLYFSGYYGFAVPYFPSLSLFHLYFD